VAVDHAAGIDRVRNEASLKSIFGFGRTLQKASINHKKDSGRERDDLARREVVQKTRPLRLTRKVDEADRLIRAIEVAAPRLIQ
jgi:hypothetical protein